MGWLSKLSGGLKKSSDKLSTGVKQIFTQKKLDDDTLDELEELLITADLGIAAAERIRETIAASKYDKEISEEEIKDALSEAITDILAPVTKELTLDDAAKPHVVLVVGVNGNGKTTTIGKLAKQYQDEGKKVMLAACDTFRAAAVEQLAVWADRVGCEIVTGPSEVDPASVAYQALEKAKKEGADVLLIDTAGRLHNKKDLMDQLAKIIRVMKKLDDAAPQHCLLVLDATTGQNAHKQVEVFKEVVDINGLIVTKLDGSAKGGVVVALAESFELPLYAIGVGEAVEDLQPFDAKSFADRLVGIA